MKVRLLSLSLFLTFLPAQVTLAGSDALCAPLREFIKAVQPGETKTLEFHTSWGSNFKDATEPALWAKRCDHFGYEPAKPVCAYFMEHGAIEFSDRNLQRAVTCLSPRTRFDPGVSMPSAVISLAYGTDGKGSNVTFNLSWSDEVGAMVLQVAAHGY